VRLKGDYRLIYVNASRANLSTITRRVCQGRTTGSEKEITVLMHRLIAQSAVALGMILALSACTDPYDPGQRALGGGLIGAGTGAAIGGLAGGGRGAATGALIGGAVGAVGGAVTTPQPPPPGYYQPPGYYPPSGYYQQPGYYPGYYQQPGYYRGY
jgi:hypothetical protein